MHPKKFLKLLPVLFLAGTVSAQTLLYEWNFDNGTATSTTPDVSAGGGTLTLVDVSGSGAAGNTLTFGSTNGPGGGLGAATGALVANGQGYSSGNTAIAMGTVTGLGNLSAFTVSFWFNLGSSVSNTFPRFVSVGAVTNYDAGGKGAGNIAPGFGTSINGWSGGIYPASTLQNGLAGTLGVTNEPSTQGGVVIVSNTWYYEAMTYDGTNLITYLGTLSSNAVQVASVGAAAGALNFGTNGVVMIGNIDNVTQPRAINYGSIADVRIYGGAQTPSQVVNVQTNAAWAAATNRPYATVPVISPANVIYLGSSITATSAVTGAVPISYQWRTDGGGGVLTNIPGAVSSTLTNTPSRTGTIQYAVVVANSYGSSTSAVATLTVQPTPSTGNVTINVSSNLATVASTAYGIHTAIYDNQNGNSLLATQLVQAGATMIRYPGGGFADVFHWSVTRPALGSANGYGLTPWFGNTNSFGYMGPNTDFGSFVKLLTNAQCQALITIDFGSGLKWATAGHTNLTVPSTNAESPEAAAWVAYANASTNIYGTVNDITLGTDSLGNDWKTAGYWAVMRASAPLGTDDGYNFLRIGRKAPIGIQYWEIGNETFGSGYYSSGGSDGYSVNYSVQYHYTNFTRYGNTNLSPAAYGKAVKVFSQLMKSVDPTIKIGAVVTTPPSDYSWDVYGGQHWTPQVLAQCASNIDFVISHWYPYAGSLGDGTALLANPSSVIPTMINGSGNHSTTNAGLRDYISAYRSDATNVQIFVTEFGYSGSLTNALNGEPVYGPANALFAADSYASWFELGVSNADWVEMNDYTFLGDSSPLTRGGAYYAMQLTHCMADPGDTMISAVSDAATLRAHAAQKQNGKISVLLLNESLTNSLSVTVSIPNVSLNSSVTQIQFGTNNFTGTNMVPGTAPSTNSLSMSGNSLTVTVPAYTMAVLAFSTATVTNANTAPVLAAISNYTVNPGQTVSFTASATDTDTPPQTLTFALLSGATNATLGSAGAFSWRPLTTQASSTNGFAVKVTDSGTPSLSATQSFSVIVNPLLQSSISTVASTNGQVSFKVTGQSGPDYEIQSSTNLSRWTAVFVTNSPALPFNWSDTAGTNAVRFYRVVAGPPLP